MARPLLRAQAGALWPGAPSSNANKEPLPLNEKASELGPCHLKSSAVLLLIPPPRKCGDTGTEPSVFLRGTASGAGGLPRSNPCRPPSLGTDHQGQRLPLGSVSSAAFTRSADSLLLLFQPESNSARDEPFRTEVSEAGRSARQQALISAPPHQIKAPCSSLAGSALL